MDTTQEFFQLRRRPFDKDLPDESLWLDPDRTDLQDKYDRPALWIRTRLSRSMARSISNFLAN